MEIQKKRELALRLGLGGAAAVAAVLGYVGFWVYLPHPGLQAGTWWTDLIYYTLQLFLLDAAPLQSATDLPVVLEIARFLAPLTTAATLGATIKKVYDSTYRAARARALDDHTVVCGGGTAALLIARDVAAEHRTCVLVGTADGAGGGGAVLRIVGDPRDPAVLREAHVERAREIVVTGDGTRTTDVAAALRGVLGETGATPQCFLEMSSPAFAAALVAHEINSGSTAQFEFFDPTDRAARRLLDARLPVASRGKLLLVGEGALHDAVARQFRRRTGAGQELRTWTPAEALGSDRPPADLAVVIVAVDDDARAVQLGLALVTRLADRPVDVVVATSTSTALGSLITGDEIATDLGAARLRLFNTNEHVYRLSSLRDGIYLDIARATHEAYLEQVAPGSTSSTVPWDDLPEERRRANIAQALSIGEKLRSLRLAVVPSDGSPSRFGFDGNELDRLAEAEHARWMAERRQEGWTFGKPRDDVAKKHPDLVEWGDLPKPVRKKDVDAMRAVPGHLARVGLQILRTSSPGVGTPARDGSA